MLARPSGVKLAFHGPTRKNYACGSDKRLQVSEKKGNVEWADAFASRCTANNVGWNNVRYCQKPTFLTTTMKRRALRVQRNRTESPEMNDETSRRWISKKRVKWQCNNIIFYRCGCWFMGYWFIDDRELLAQSVIISCDNILDDNNRAIFLINVRAVDIRKNKSTQRACSSYNSADMHLPITRNIACKRN